MAIKEESLCECGCGGTTTISKRNDASRGYTKGKPRRFIRGHHRRLQGPEYTIEDRGYDTPCWIWARSKSSSGYGNARRPGGGQMTAHRMMYERVYGLLPKNLEPDHLCGVKMCVNPDHLEAVTRSENTRRGRLGKLSLDAIREIRSTSGPHLEMALKHGVTGQHVSMIRIGMAHREVV